MSLSDDDLVRIGQTLAAALRDTPPVAFTAATAPVPPASAPPIYGKVLGWLGGAACTAMIAGIVFLVTQIPVMKSDLDSLKADVDAMRTESRDVLSQGQIEDRLDPIRNRSLRNQENLNDALERISRLEARQPPR